MDRHGVIIGQAGGPCYGYRMLTDQQIETYRRDGYLVIPRLIQGEQLAELRDLTDRIVGEARGVSANDELYDLEPTHSAALPRVRRLKPRSSSATPSSMRWPAIPRSRRSWRSSWGRRSASTAASST